jgi:hypothetical protein
MDVPLALNRAACEMKPSLSVVSFRRDAGLWRIGSSEAAQVSIRFDSTDLLTSNARASDLFGLVQASLALFDPSSGRD